MGMKWTVEEEETLTAGVAKHGAGRWKKILKDLKFAPKLACRSNVHLKDKWRNMVANHRQSSGANATTPQTPSSVNCNAHNKPPQSPKLNEVILEALSSIKDPRGSSFTAILGFIDEKYEVSESFRRILSSRLRKLVLIGTLKKVERRYKIKRDSLGTKTPIRKRKSVGSRSLQDSAETIVDDAAKTATHKIAPEEIKSSMATEADEESERISQMAANADTVLMHLKGILENCSRVAVLLMV